jgi:hypothetical protein
VSARDERRRESRAHVEAHAEETAARDLRRIAASDSHTEDARFSPHALMHVDIMLSPTCAETHSKQANSDNDKYVRTGARNGDTRHWYGAVRRGLCE